MSLGKHLASSDDDSENDRNKRSRLEISPDSSDKENIAGYVENLHMKNFMCHSSLEVTFNNKINFIVGRNGSGKSAILAAVVIALGCKASSTNRASSIKDFVKSGASSATVQVTLCNEGVNAYEQEVYGSKIIVERKIFSNSGQSSYKFKSAGGDLVSTKREELDKIIVALNIQVDNPISVLNQDTARTFLTLTDNNSKYSFFLKATKLDDVDQMHVKSLNCEACCRNRIKTRIESLKSQEKDIEVLEKKVKAVKKLEKIKTRCAVIEKEFYWALARDQENLLLELKREIEKEENNGKILKINFEKYKIDLENKMILMSQVQVQVEDQNKKMKERHESFQKLKNLYREAKQNVRSHSLILKRLSKESMNCSLEIEGVRHESNRHKGSEEVVFEMNRLLRSIDTCKVDEKKIAAAQGTTEELFSNLRDQLERFHEQGNLLQREKNAIEQAIGGIKYKIKASQSNENNLAVYGKWMPKLIQRIEECNKKGLFVRKPLGPLGTMLSVKDREWAYAIQSELQSILRMFACHCPKDSKILLSLYKELSIDTKRQPGIIISKFMDQLYDIQNTCVRVPGYQNLFDAVQFMDVNVANIMIDNRSIETTLLIPTNEEAIMMMSKSAPKNCMRSITKTADLFFPYPDYRTYASDQREHVSLLKISQEELIRQLEEQLKAKEENLNKKKFEIMELNNNVNKNKNELERVAKRIKELKDHKLTIINEITSHENALERLPDPQQFQMMETELRELTEKSAILKEQIEKGQEEGILLGNKEYQASEDVKRIEAEMNEMNESVQNLQAEFANQKEIVRKAESRVKYTEGLLSEHTIKVNKMMELLEEKQKQTEEAVKCACNVCPERILSKRAANDIKREMDDIQTYQSMIEEEASITPDIFNILKEKKTKYQENVDHLELIKSGFQVLSQSLKERSKLYLVIKKLMELKVSYVFRPLMFNRGYKGDMIFDHAAKTLEVSVFPKQEVGKRTTKTLSGGERSYSTIAFILALWNCVEPPFYFMDEFDVFMDKVNRKIVIEMLLSQARENKKHQYVFLTPQDTSTVHASEDITIHKLDDPERANEHTQRL